MCSFHEPGLEHRVFQAKTLRRPIFRKMSSDRIDFKANNKYCCEGILQNLCTNVSSEMTFEEYLSSISEKKDLERKALEDYLIRQLQVSPENDAMTSRLGVESCNGRQLILNSVCSSPTDPAYLVRA